MKNTLLMPFIDESESFTNGFECGQIWEKISQGEMLEKYLCHSENEEQIKRLNDYSSNYRMAKKYNLISEQPKEIEFYFETYNQ